MRVKQTAMLTAIPLILSLRSFCLTISTPITKFHCADKMVTQPPFDSARLDPSQYNLNDVSSVCRMQRTISDFMSIVRANGLGNDYESLISKFCVLVNNQEIWGPLE